MSTLNIKYKIGICVPYFGKVKDFFKIWATSASFNKEVDFLLFTDDVSAVQYCSRFSNFFIKQMSFCEMQELIKKKLNDKCYLERPYKLCDYKPAYGLIFEDFLSKYDFWGYCDVDLVFGRISKFLTTELLDEFDHIMTLGHFSLNRNTEKMNNLFKFQLFNGYINFPYIYRKNACISVFDEIQFNNICAHNHIKTFNSYDFYCDLHVHELGFLNSKNKIVKDYFVATLSSDGLFAHQYDGSKPVEQLYLHLQKREMDIRMSEFDKIIIIFPNACEILGDNDVSKYFVIKHDNEYTKIKNNEKKRATNKIKIQRKIEHILFGRILSFLKGKKKIR